MLEKKIEQEE